jgi:YD repeat-containing protein
VTSPTSVVTKYGYDTWGHLSSITLVESGMVSFVTSFVFDVGNLTSEVRTGTKPYSGAYTYFADNQRKTAVVVTNGVTTHKS